MFMEDIFKFGDFLSGKQEKLKSIKKVLENLEESFDDENQSDDDYVDYSNNPYDDKKELLSSEEPELDEDSIEVENNDSEDDSEEEPKMITDWLDKHGDPEILEKVIKESEESEESEEIEDSVEEVDPEEDYYKLYADKSENFVCDISIQGADPKQSEARIIVESGDWTLMFYGELKGGKCIVPIKKLNILKEGQVGDIRLEVIAEGNIFIPWEDKFKVNVSKKVTVKVNEQKDYTSKKKNKMGVKVNVRK